MFFSKNSPKNKIIVRYLMLSRQNNDFSSQQEKVVATWGCESAAASLGWVGGWGGWPKFSQTLKVQFVRTS